jgi:MerR family mercuric resistance operon transcriptional regulator
VFTIGKFAEAGNVGVETVRFYQRKGLLVVPSNTGGARRYGKEDLRRLKFIRKAQTAGFTLEEIKELLSLDAGNDHARANQMAEVRIHELDIQIAELQQARNSLAKLSDECCHTQQGLCPILEAFGV